MVDIASISHEASSILLYDINHISKSILRLIREDHPIGAHDKEASTSHEPSRRPPTSSIAIMMQPIQDQGRGRGKGSGRGCGPSDGSTYETFIPPKYFTLTPETSIPPAYSTPPS